MPYSCESFTDLHGGNMKNIELWAVCTRHYFPQNLRISSEDTRRQYRFAVRDFTGILDRRPLVSDLTDANLARLVRYLRESRQLKPVTINERIGRLKSLWTWLAKRGHVRKFPTIGRLPEAEQLPTAWSEPELHRLYIAAGSMPGMVGAIPASEWWQGLLSWLWYTGERIGATLAMQWEHIDLRGAVATLPAEIRKQRRKSACYRLPPALVQRLVAMRDKTRSPIVFAWEKSLCSYYLEWNRLLRIAGLPGGRKRKSQSMRVSHATWLTVAGGNAAASLLHLDAATTRAHYLDPRIAAPPPTRLFGLD